MIFHAATVVPCSAIPDGMSSRESTGLSSSWTVCGAPGSVNEFWKETVLDAPPWNVPGLL